MKRVPGRVVGINFVNKAEVLGLPAQQACSLARINVLFQGEALGKSAYDVGGFVQGNIVDLAGVGCGTSRSLDHLTDGCAGSVHHIEYLTADAALGHSEITFS